MTTTKRRLTVDDLAPGWRARVRTRTAPTNGQWHEIDGWANMPDDDRIVARLVGRASWHYVSPTDVIASSIRPPVRKDEP